MDDCASAQYPPITGKLREKLAEYKPTEGKCNLITRAVGSTGYARLIELCDTIDAIHAQLERDYQCACNVNERQDMEHTQLKAERDQARADCAVAEEEGIRLSDEVSRLKEQMGHHDYAPESHYVMLPKDADGVPIHIGDVMEWCNGSFTVHELKLTEDGWQTWDSEHGYTVHADECIRHHTPTVEDVLREFGINWEYESDCEDRAALLAEYAAKLRLAGDAE